MLFILMVLAVLLAVVVYDVTQKKHAVLRNFPIIGHLRYILEAVGPELRQYIVTDNDEERPFSRDQRRWVYASAKKENAYFGFGSDNDIESLSQYLIVKHSAFPLLDPHEGDADFDATYSLPCSKVLGAARGRARAFRPRSVVNVSGMSFGSMSHAAVRAMNEGCRIATCLQNTGEGGVSPHHLHGGDLVWQIGTGYFGCRDERGHFSLDRLKETVARHPSITALEIKLSQGAKPGLGGILPGAKVTEEIARIRGIPQGQTCVSPSAHSAFSSVDEMLDFVESVADETGLPVGIKSAVGDDRFWLDLARMMQLGSRGVDFITIDGGEGGTGAGPLVFTDHVALPFKMGFARVYRAMFEQGVTERIVFVGSGKLGFPETALQAIAMGADMVAVGREAMMAIGCIQAQRCHTGHCPTGVATHNRWLVRGLDPTSKSHRLANYVLTLRKELTRLSRACGVVHPALVTCEQLELIDGAFTTRTVREAFGYSPEMDLVSEERRQRLVSLMSVGVGA